MGGGIASRFSLALSKIIDPSAESNTTGNTGDQEDNEEITQMRELIDELNQHTDLTVKLSNQAKICKIFAGTGTSSKNTSLMKRKLEQNLKNVDPEIKQIFNTCKAELQAIQQKKDDAIDEYIDQQTEDKIV